LFFGCEEVKKEIITQEIPDVQHLYLFSQEIGEKWHSNEEPWRFQMAGVEFLYTGNYKMVFDKRKQEWTEFEV
jgi:hypothetical protein